MVRITSWMWRSVSLHWRWLFASFMEWVCKEGSWDVKYHTCNVVGPKITCCECVRWCHHTEPFPNFSLPFQEMRAGPSGSVSLKKGALQRLLEVMKLDWALQSNSFQDMCRLSRTLAWHGPPIHFEQIVKSDHCESITTHVLSSIIERPVSWYCMIFFEIWCDVYSCNWMSKLLVHFTIMTPDGCKVIPHDTA